MKDLSSNVRIQIANLASALKHFHPHPDCLPLVNEKDIPKRFVPDDGAPTIDQLVGINIAAIMELLQFLKFHEKMKAHYETLTADCMIAHQHAIAFGLKCEGVTEIVETLIGKLNQAVDVFKSIEENTHEDDIRNVCLKFREKLLPPKSAIPFPSSGPEPSGDN